MFRARVAFQSLIATAVTALLASVLGADPGFAPLDSGLVVFRASRFEEAQPFFARAVADSPAHVAARCWLAQTRRRIGRQEDAVREARAALALDPHSSFAHMVLADCYDPALGGWAGTSADSAWTQIRQAAADDPRNGEAWLSVWKHSVARGDSARERESLMALGSIGYFTPAVIAYNRWQLEFLPPKAVLLTRGDTDTYPSAMLQTVSNVRADVAIVNLSLLNWPDYAKAIARRAGLPLPARIDSSKAPRDSTSGAASPGVADRVVSSWADSVKRGAFPRPLSVAASASRIGETPALLGRLTLAGPFYDVARDTGAAPDDLTRLSATVAAIDPQAFAGPWTSDLDQSSIRVAGGGGLGANLLNAALRYGRASLEAGDKPGALAAVAKLDSLAAVLRPGQVMRGKIRRLQAAATRP